MRRQSAIAALSMAFMAAVMAALLAGPLLAQMHGGGSRGGAAMGRGGISSSGAVGFRGGSSFGGGQHLGAGFGTGLRQPFFRPSHSFVGFRQPFFGPRRFRRPVFFSGASPFYFGYYGYSAYDSGYSTADYSPAYDYYASANAAQNDMAQQQQDIDRLEDEVARLREQREPRDAPRPQAENTSEVSTPTLLIFRDKHTQEVQNYAIVGGTLWIFGEQRATKLPLSWLDIEATTQANDDRGVDFQVPQ
jgi:cell division protein FtsB